MAEQKLIGCEGATACADKTVDGLTMHMNIQLRLFSGASAFHVYKWLFQYYLWSYHSLSVI